MATWLVRGSFLALLATISLGNCAVANGNHRRGAYAPHHRHCQLPAPQVAVPMQYYSVLPQTMAAPQAAPIPPGLVPIVMTVGQDLAGLAAQQLLELIRNRLGGSLPLPTPTPQVDVDLSPNVDLTNLDARLQALEKRVGVTPPVGVTPSAEVRKGAVAIPDGKPSQFPRFLYPQ